MIAFKAYRAFEQARVAANDASMSLLVGSRLAIETLETLGAADDARLPDLFPHLEEMRYVTLNTEQSVALLRSSERFLAYMAIPFIVSVHETLLVVVLGMLSDDGVWSDPQGRSPEKLELSGFHAAIFDACREQLSEEAQVVLDRNLELFDFIRLMRVRLGHYGGASGERLRERWKALSNEAKDEWIRLAKRPFDARDHEPLPLSRDDLIAVLATTKHIAETVNQALEKTLSRDYWGETVVRDYRDTNPEHWRNREKRLDRVGGHARFYYGSLELTKRELEGALAAVEAAT